MIKRINPFIVVGILVIILFIVWTSVQSRRSSISEENRQLAQYEAKAKGLQGLKSKWKQKNITAKLNAIVSNPELKKNTIIKKQGNKATIQVSNINKSQADMIMKNLLNEPFSIKKFDIKRVNDKTINLNVEVSI